MKKKAKKTLVFFPELTSSGLSSKDLNYSIHDNRTLTHNSSRMKSVLSIDFTPIRHPQLRRRILAKIFALLNVDENDLFIATDINRYVHILLRSDSLETFDLIHEITAVPMHLSALTLKSREYDCFINLPPIVWNHGIDRVKWIEHTTPAQEPLAVGIPILCEYNHSVLPFLAVSASVASTLRGSKFQFTTK